MRYSGSWWVLRLALCAYGAILIRIVVFKNFALHLGAYNFRFPSGRGDRANLVPFSTIASYTNGMRRPLIACLEIGGNVGLFVPFGILLSLVSGKLNSQSIALAALLVPLAMELAQLVLGLGVFDIDDVILNTLGVLLGFWIARAVWGRAGRQVAPTGSGNRRL